MVDIFVIEMSVKLIKIQLKVFNVRPVFSEVTIFKTTQWAELDTLKSWL